MRASPCIKYVLSPCLHRQGGAVCADLHTEAPHSKRQCGAYFAFRGAGESQPPRSLVLSLKKVHMLANTVRPYKNTHDGGLHKGNPYETFNFQYCLGQRR